MPYIKRPLRKLPQNSLNIKEMYQFKAKLLTLLMLAGCAATEEPPQEVVRSERPALGRMAVGRW